jgi:hypothetical protein
MGKWRVENNKMNSTVPGRTVDAVKLEQRLVNERKAGPKTLTAEQSRQVTNDPLTSP